MATIDALRDLVWAKTNGICELCGETVSRREMHIDHIIPRAVGGPDSLENYRPAHRLCNMRRKDGRKRGPEHPFWKGGGSIVKLRLSTELLDALQDEALANGRSVDAEMLARLHEYVESH